MKKRRPTIRRRLKQEGAILSLMVVLTLLLAMASLALAHLGQQSRLRAVRSTAAMAARMAADAGIQRVLYLMNEQLAADTWTVDNVPVFESEPLPASNAEYTVTFSGDLNSGYELLSTGVCGSQTQRLRVLIGLTSPFSDDFAVLTKGKLTMKAKAEIDGYNSSNPSDTDVVVAIGTLSNQAGQVDIKNNSTLDGDVYVGPGGDPLTVIDMKDRESISGELFTMPVPYYLPSIGAPSFVANKGSLQGNSVTLQTSDSGKYSSISINNNGKLEISGDLVLYVTGGMELKNGAELKVNDGSTLKLYIDGNISAKNSAGINNKGKVPSDVQIYGTGSNQTFDLKNASDLYGVVYAPEATMSLDNSGNAYGSFITKSFELKNSGKVYYDEALRQASLSDEGIRFSVLRWEEL
jgi:hypothetical protein